MKIRDARITMLASSGNPPGWEVGVRIQLYDYDASIMFAEIELTSEQWVAAMSRQSHVECSIDVRGLDKLGKRMVNKPFEFPLEGSTDFMKDREIAQALVEKVCPEGWQPDTYFNSQNSFFTKDGERWARTTIRKWVDIDAETDQ